MPRTTHVFAKCLVIAILAQLVGATGAGAAPLSRAAAAPDSPQALPPTDVSWFPVGLTGGPAYELAISLGSEGGQRVIAAGNEVFTSYRAGAWRLTRDRTGPVVNVAAGSDGALYAATASGEGYRSSNYGRNWYGTRLRGDAPIHFVAVSPDFATDELAFGITRDDWRLYRADRGGSSWLEVIIDPDADPRYQFAAVGFSWQYETDETFFVASDRGIFKTEDAGLHWELKCSPEDGAPAFGEAGGEPSSQGLVIPREYGDDPDLRFDPDLETIFAYNAHGIYRSDDDGETWNRLALDVEQVNGLALSNGWPDDPVLLAAVSDPSGAVGAASEDDGQTWRMIQGADGLVGTSAAMAYDFAYIPPEVNPDLTILYLPITLRDWVLGEVGRTWPMIEPTGSREMYLATDGAGVWRSRDMGVTWSKRSVGLVSAQATDLAFLPGGPNSRVLAGTGTAGLYTSPDGGRNWRWLDTGLPRGSGQAIHALRLSPDFATDSTVYLAAESGVWVSRDGGLSWSPPAESSPTPATTLDISPAFATDRTLVAAGHISTDGGATWTELTGNPNWAAVSLSARYASDSEIWVGYAVTADGPEYTLARSRDGGQTWEQVENSLVRNREVHDIEVVSVVSAEPNRVFVGTSRGLIASHDNGEKWERISELSRAAHAITSLTLQDPEVGTTAIVLAAGVDGAAWSINRGLDWTDEPEAPRGGSCVTVSEDGSVLLVGVPAAVARYGEGSALTFLPKLENNP